MLSRSAPLPSAMAAKAGPSRLQANARRRSMQARGETELVIFERIAPAYSDEDEDDDEEMEYHHEQHYELHHSAHLEHDPSDDEQSHSESSDGQDEEMVQLPKVDPQDDVAEMSLDEDSPDPPPTRVAPPALPVTHFDDDHSSDEGFKAPLPMRKLDKGKGKARAHSTSVPPIPVVSRSYQDEIRERERMLKERESARAERRASLSARRPVICLRRDSGFVFSNEALMPAYLRERYSSSTVGGTTTDTPSASSHAGSSRSPAYGSPHGASVLDGEEEDGQPACVDIFVSQDESRRILP